MRKYISAYILALCLALAGTGTALASPEAEAFDPVHHVSDGPYVDFSPFGRLELPRIFLVRDAAGRYRLDAFRSTTAAIASRRYHAVSTHATETHPPVDTAAVPAATEAHPSDAHAVPPATHATESGAVPPATHAGETLAGAALLDAVILPVDGTLVVDFSWTRHYVFALLGSILIAVVFITLARRYRRGVGRTTAPKGTFQNLFELLVVFVRDEIAKPMIGPRYQRFVPYLLTAFFFILFCNLLGLVPFGATATSNLMVTATLAVMTFLTVQFSGSKDYWRHILWPPGVPTPMKFIIIPVEFIGILTKPFALAIRLFANMTAGHLVILSFLGLIFTFYNLFGAAGGYGISVVSVSFSLAIFMLELLVSVIQAYIFTMLSALYIGMATATHDEGHHEHEPETFAESADIAALHTAGAATV